MSQRNLLNQLVSAKVWNVTQTAFITLKEHNQNTVAEKSSVNQWRNTYIVEKPNR